MTKSSLDMRIPFGTISVSDYSRELIENALNSNRLSSGRFVREFEEEFARLVGSGHAVAVSSGTDALAVALAVLYDYGARRNDEVILPALSFVATGNAVVNAGFKPVFVDVRPETLNIDPEAIESAITEKTRALLPVHLMGKPAEMDKINEIAERHGLYVIEDAAEAHGAVYRGRNVGTLGNMAAYSLYVAHIITTIEGGIVTTDDPETAGILRSLRSHGRACKCKSCVLNTDSTYCKRRFEHGRNHDIRFIFERTGFSCKMNELEAAVGLGSLRDYDEILKKRRANLYYLIEAVGQFRPFIYTISKEPYEELGPHALPLVVSPEAPFGREELAAFMEEKGIDTRTLFSSIPTQCRGFAYLGHKTGEFPNAEYTGENGLHIGVHQDLEKQHCDYIIDVLSTFVKEKAI
jgi:dTDP-4-amino-4,6-dideoxygalactose transaminase